MRRKTTAWLVNALGVLVTSSAMAQHAGFADRSGALPAGDSASSPHSSSVCSVCGPTTAAVGSTMCVEADDPPSQRINGSLWQDPALGINGPIPGSTTFIDTVCIAPGDYRSWGTLVLTEQNNSLKTVMRTGDDGFDHPGNNSASPSEQVLIAAIDVAGSFNPSSNWHVQGLTVSPLQAAYSLIEPYVATRAKASGLSRIRLAEDVTLTRMAFRGDDAVPAYSEPDGAGGTQSCPGPAFDTANPDNSQCVVATQDPLNSTQLLAANQYFALLLVESRSVNITIDDSVFRDSYWQEADATDRHGILVRGDDTPASLGLGVPRNVRIRGNEFIDVTDGIQVATPSPVSGVDERATDWKTTPTAATSPEENPWRSIVAGLLISDNDFAVTKYTDCLRDAQAPDTSLTATPGSPPSTPYPRPCMCAENGIDIKSRTSASSELANAPGGVIRGNRFVGYGVSTGAEACVGNTDTNTGQNATGAGSAMVLHFAASDLLVTDNIVYDSAAGIGVGGNGVRDCDDAVNGLLGQCPFVIHNNLLWNVGVDAGFPSAQGGLTNVKGFGLSLRGRGITSSNNTLNVTDGNYVLVRNGGEGVDQHATDNLVVTTNAVYQASADPAPPGEPGYSVPTCPESGWDGSNAFVHGNTATPCSAANTTGALGVSYTFIGRRITGGFPVTLANALPTVGDHTDTARPPALDDCVYGGGRVGLPSDADGDGVPDGTDDCPLVFDHDVVRFANSGGLFCVSIQATVDPTATLSGDVRIHAGAVVGATASVHDSDIDERAWVAGDVTQSSVQCGAFVADSATVRNGATVETSASVGMGADVSGATLGTGSRLEPGAQMGFGALAAAGVVLGAEYPLGCGIFTA